MFFWRRDRFILFRIFVTRYYHDLSFEEILVSLAFKDHNTLRNIKQDDPWVKVPECSSTSHCVCSLDSFLRIGYVVPSAGPRHTLAGRVSWCTDQFECVFVRWQSVENTGKPLILALFERQRVVPPGSNLLRKGVGLFFRHFLEPPGMPWAVPVRLVGRTTNTSKTIHD